MPIVTYNVYYIVVTHSGREFRVTSTVEVETPPEETRELETVILMKLLDRNPDAKTIEVINFNVL